VITFLVIEDMWPSLSGWSGKASRMTRCGYGLMTMNQAAMIESCGPRPRPPAAGALAAIRDVHALGRGIASQGIDPRAVENGCHHFAGMASTATDVLLQPPSTRFDALSQAMPVGASQGASGRDAAVFDVLTSIICVVFLLVVDKDVSLAIGRGAVFSV
jgi:hypothetical protein